MTRIRLGILSIILASLMGMTGALPPASAQDVSALGDGPLALDAADGVEWRREERIFVAEGDAVARQGDVTIKADRLVAAYRESPEGKLEIFRVDAEGRARVESGGDVATGGRAIFDLDRSTVVFSGGRLKYANAQSTVTANRSLEYYVKQRRAVARGDARVQDTRGRIAANVIEARFTQSGGQALRTAIATGGVTIVMPDETVRANRAEYDFIRRRAVATGNVRLARGQNVLTGGKAVIDFKTGISRMSGGAKASGGGDGKNGGRVRGLIFPQAKP